MSKPTSHREIEFKFAVPPNAEVDLTELLAGCDMPVTALAQRNMDATYYDTPNLSLLRWGITLRHRTGGGDDGWHMKVPVGETPNGAERDEIHASGGPTPVPWQLATLVAPLTRRQELLAMAIVRTHRTPFLIHGDNGEDLVEVVDDHVTVASPEPSAEKTNATAFHEIEVELLIDSKAARRAADMITRALRKQGALPSSISKAARALGPAAADQPDVPELAFPAPTAPAIDSLKAIFSSYVRALLLADVGVRRDIPDSVHQMRVACRRLRSSLKTFAPMLDDDAVSYLREELRWLASELGEVRDAEVQSARLRELAEDEAVREFIGATLDARLRAATSSALAALRSDRHDLLLEDLILLVSEPPVSTAAFDPSDQRLPECVAEQWRRLTRTVGRASIDGPAEQWHDVRIRAKQARYAAESVAPILGADFTRLGKALAEATDILGARQDAHVASLVLRSLAESAPGPIAFELGALATRGEQAGDQDIRAFSRRWPDIVRRAGRAGLE